MRIRSKTLLGILLCLSTAYSTAVRAQQQPLESQLEELFGIAERNNSTLRSCMSAVNAAQEALKAAQADLLPNVGVQLSLSYNGNGTVWNRDFGSRQVAHIPHFGNGMLLHVDMPIYTGGALSSSISLAQKKQEMTILEKDEARGNIRMLITQLYLAMHTLRNQQRVFDDNISLTEQMVGLMQKRCDEGVVLQNDVTRYELMLEKLKLQRTELKNQFLIVGHQLAKTLGTDQPITELPDSGFSLGLIGNLGEGDWQSIARENSHGMKKTELAKEMSRERIKIEKAELLPHVAVLAEDNLTGPITIDIPAINKNFNYWFVGVGVTYNVSSLFKNNKKVRQATAEALHADDIVQATADNLDIAIQTAYTNLQTSLASLDTHRKAVELARDNYEVVSNRYNNGLALVTDMLDASNEKLDAELKLVNANIQVLLNYFNIKHISGTL